jgi:hypothetical protein
LKTPSINADAYSRRIEPVDASADPARIFAEKATFIPIEGALREGSWRCLQEPQEWKQDLQTRAEFTCRCVDFQCVADRTLVRFADPN